MGWKIIIAPSAQADLADIVRYVARHNSDAAARLGYELITRAENLGNFPEIGRAVPEFRAFPVPPKKRCLEIQS
jgi:toxin ParE1/3/4